MTEMLLYLDAMRLNYFSSVLSFQGVKYVLFPLFFRL